MPDDLKHFRASRPRATEYALAVIAAALAVTFAVEARTVPHAQPRQAEISPPQPMCTATRYGGWPDRTLWRRYVIAQQADGARWIIHCEYDKGTLL